MPQWDSTFWVIDGSLWGTRVADFGGTRVALLHTWYISRYHLGRWLGTGDSILSSYVGLLLVRALNTGKVYLNLSQEGCPTGIFFMKDALYLIRFP